MLVRNPIICTEISETKIKKNLDAAGPLGDLGCRAPAKIPPYSQNRPALKNKEIPLNLYNISP